jgi:hypothetical protein
LSRKSPGNDLFYMDFSTWRLRDIAAFFLLLIPAMLVSFWKDSAKS